MGRDKLKQLGIDLPLFPTTTVGSFPKPDYLLQARAGFLKGEIGPEKLRDLEKKATEFWIGVQEELGIDVVVDGEQYRGDMVAFFAEHLSGFEIGGLVRSYGNRYYRKPIIVSEVAWPGPITVEWWRFAQSLTSKPVKGMLTGPYTIMDWSFNEYYPDRKSACFALAREIRKEVEALIEAGAKIIQIDEPATSVRPEELDMVVESMHIVTDGLPAYFITHICYGDFESIYPSMLRIPVDNFDLEMSNSNLDLLNLFKRYPFSADISFGVIDVHSHKIEDLETVKERIKSALEVLPKENVWIDPDCGLKTRTIDETIAKLKVMLQAVREFRG
ncbi:MAG: methionine synthase [Deltaproteobacteria bacterium]|jgi:5-methyltetrahydropteroyltriglutamate--homocysteine methyltransferase|nr:MAG: methionine synthase [Deltaproteobacteria bacterium]